MPLARERRRDTTEEEIGLSSIAGTGTSVVGATTTGTMRGAPAISGSRSFPFQSVKCFGSSTCARQQAAWVSPDLRWAARCSAHQARMSSRRLEGESRFFAIGTLLRQYVMLGVPGNAFSP